VSTVRLLDAGADATAWTDLLGRLPAALRDTYFTPEYAALSAAPPGERARLFAFERGGDMWAYPFLLRAVPPLVAGLGERFDVETPYGYGGPLSTSDDPAFLADAHGAFAEWCASAGVVAEFARYHPLLGNERWAPAAVATTFDRPTISIPFAAAAGGGTFDSAEARYVARRLERAGVRVSAFPVEEHFDRFLALYLRTMERLGADGYFRFSDRYFAELARLTARSGWLVAAEDAAGEWVAAGVFFRGPRFAHYHLSGSDPDRRVNGSTNGIIFEAARRAAAAGMERLHLGGGRTAAPDDSLLRFKRSVGSDEHRFLIGQRVHDRDSYDALRDAWRVAHPGLVATYGRRLLCYRYAPAAAPATAGGPA
jgi:hypothetical protein